MVNESELLINVVSSSKPKMLRGLNQKVSSQEQWAIRYPAVDDALPAKRQNLTYSGAHVERGKPAVLPQGKASRKTSRWNDGYRRMEKANAIS